MTDSTNGIKISDEAIIEQILHAFQHSKLMTDFDRRTAFINFDNAIELLVRKATRNQPDYTEPTEMREKKDEVYNFFKDHLSDVCREYYDVHHKKRNSYYHHAIDSPNEQEVKEIAKFFFRLCGRLFEEEDFNSDVQEVKEEFIKTYELMVRIYCAPVFRQPFYAPTEESMQKTFYRYWKGSEKKEMKKYLPIIQEVQKRWVDLKINKIQNKYSDIILIENVQEMRDIIDFILDTYAFTEN